jgi:hypothetical protein
MKDQQLTELTTQIADETISLQGQVVDGKYIEYKNTHNEECHLRIGTLRSRCLLLRGDPKELAHLQFLQYEGRRKWLPNPRMNGNCWTR